MRIEKMVVPLLLTAAMVFSGCAWFGNKHQEKNAHQLVQEGVRDYDRGNYKAALKAFGRLRDWYPFSKYAILAELKIADAHYHLQEYPEAVAAYRDFERLHPRNEAAAYAMYQVGLCYFEQISTIDRDQTAAQKALDNFRRVIRQFPGNPYAKQAQNHIVACLKSLAGHEFFVGRFYFRQKQYAAALHRFLTVIRKYPDVGYHDRALQYIAKCEAYKPVNRQIAQ